MNKNAALLKESLSVNLGQLMFRFGLGLVFVLFGYDKFAHPSAWLVYISPSLVETIKDLSGLSMYGFFRWQGLFEFILGIHLIIGIWVRVAAFLCVILLVGIIWVVGLDHVGVRDLGFLFLSLGIFITGGGEWSLPNFLGINQNDRENMKDQNE